MVTAMEKRPALGKGLSALIPDAPEPRSSPVEVDVDRLSPNDFQPRVTWTTPAWRSSRSRSSPTASSSRSSSAKWAIGFRSSPANAAGARPSSPDCCACRSRSGGRAGPGEIAARDGAHREHPARRSEPDRRGAGVSPAGRGVSAEAGGHCAAVGKDRASVANYLRLLRLPEEVRAEVASGRLSMGHARALVSLTDEADQRRIARDVIARALSVRETRIDRQESRRGRRAHGLARRGRIQADRRPHTRG